MLAARKGKEKSVELLIPVSDVNATNQNGDTALMLAIKNGRDQMAELLIPVSDVKATNNAGQTALDIAKIFHPYGLDEIVQLLKQHN